MSRWILIYFEYFRIFVNIRVFRINISEFDFFQLEKKKWIHQGHQWSVEVSRLDPSGELTKGQKHLS